MAIIHEVKYKKEDGTEIEVVPIKDIVVTAPGYHNWGGDWRDDLDKARNQETQLYEAKNALYPIEADYCETIDMQTGSDGGRARFRAYIEKAKIPQLTEKIRQEMMILRSPLSYLQDQELKVKLRKELGKETQKILETPAHFVVQKLNRAVYGGGYQEAYFYSPKTKDSLGVDFNPVGKTAHVIDVRKDNIDSLLWELHCTGDDLLDKIREETLRELANKQTRGK